MHNIVRLGVREVGNQLRMSMVLFRQSMLNFLGEMTSQFNNKIIYIRGLL